MLGKLGVTTKNAPFGNDDTPILDVKIVGGRRVQFVIDNPDQNMNAQDSAFGRTWPSPHAGPHGTPSILHQPDWEAYDSNGLQSQESNTSQRIDKIRDLNRLESTYTSPLGDRSNSFKHGLPSMKTMQPLPPIASQPAALHTYHDSAALKFTSSVEKRKPTELSLKEQVAKDIRSFPYKKLKEMYIELTTYDRLLLGMVEESQFSLVALRHNLPINISLLKILFARFVDLRNPKLVNYEKILQFLSECVLHPTEDSLFPNFVLQPHNRSGTTALSLPQQKNDLPVKHSRNNGTEKSYKDGSPIRNDEEKLIHLIEAQILPDENINIKQLQASMRELDRSATGQLPEHVVNKVCVRCQLPLTDSLIVKMLKRCSTGEGMVNWQDFLAPLVEVQDRRNNNAKPKHSTRLNKEQAMDVVKSSQTDHHLRCLSQSPWQKKPLNDIRSTSPKANPVFDSPVSTASSEERLQLPDGWDAPAEIDKNGNYISPRNAEPWIHKFNKLAYALQTYNPYNSEILLRDDAERVTKNYNLIYGLGFSEKRIENAVRQSVLPVQDSSSKGRVSVDTLLALLEGKKRLLA